VNGIVKFVKAWPAERIMVVRYTADLLLCAILCAWWRLPLPGPKVAMQLMARGIAYIAFVMSLWAALRSCLPLGDVVVGVVAVSPIFLVLLTRLLLGEKIPREWPLQFVLCLIGTLLVNKPLAPTHSCGSAALLPVAAAFFGALMNFMSRNVKEVPPPVVSVFNDLVAVTFACGAMALQTGSKSLGELLAGGFDKNLRLVLVSAVIAWIGLMCNIKGYQSVSVAAVASIASYVSVPLGYVMQVLIFSEVPDILSIMGASLIFCTNVTAAASKYYAAKAVVQAQDNECYKPLPDHAQPAEALGA